VHRVISGVLLGTVVMLSPLVPARTLAQATDANLDRTFRLEWSKDGRKVNGYVYNTTSRHAAYMQLLVEGVDAAGNVVNSTKTWVRDIPPNFRAYFDVAVSDAPSYRISILSYKWIQEIASGDPAAPIPVSAAQVYTKETLEGVDASGS
jgi:hypothetical protein